MTTHLLFRDEWYAQSTHATVVAINERGGIILDRTVFYATGGGQPGDSGHLHMADGTTVNLATAVWDDPAKTRVAHVPAEGAALPAIGETVEVKLDWAVRYARMRMHTCLHLLSVALPYPVTGGSVGDGEGRLDFDIGDALDKDDVQAKLQALLARDVAVSDRWITDAELDANPGLVKTMSVQPPRGSGRIRLVEIAGLDLQPCGGTHVRRTGEIGSVVVTQIEKKGKLNRRVRLRLL
ncbi:MAG: alanyl-tRNA editing protein [Beijerinckiaceae bacterium]